MRDPPCVTFASCRSACALARKDGGRRSARNRGRDPGPLGPLGRPLPRLTARCLRPLRSLRRACADNGGPAVETATALGEPARERYRLGPLQVHVTSLLPSILQQPARPLTYCSLRKGKRKSVKSVVKRFLRLHNGLWVRRRAGYKKKLWKKSAARKKRLRELMLCTRTQCKLLDKMTTSFWKRRNWYLDDPYQKYHDRTNLRL
ncbi:39S ribosomal protein L35, mitochondrial [Indicator indicator]|uniref:39S ribosomal protein L35, mitochondrial n=1 Tax=Indicator indicator TaxID=1002788 RepID=UPI0023E00217|nr:39S ribosomal protein L35, mitochondrial [Indicator indicator]